MTQPKDVRLVTEATADEVSASIIRSSISDVRKSLDDTRGIVFTPEQFGAKGDGVADDTAAIQAAMDAAFDYGGGLVRLPNRYGFSGIITHRGAITVTGAAKAKVLAAPDNMDRGLVALGPGATYQYGSWTSANSADDNPGGLYDLQIDGAGVGGVTKTSLFIMAGVDGFLQNVRVVNSAADSWKIDGAQNSTLNNCYMGDAPNGVALTISRINNVGQGAGNIKINNTYLATSKTLLETTGDPNNFWPHDIFFNHCLFENYNAGVIAKLNCGDLHFTGTVFTNSNGDGPPTNDAVVEINQSIYPPVGTVVVFDSCYWNGGGSAAKPTSGVLVDSTGGVGNIVRFYGHQSFSNVQGCVGVKGSLASLISIEGTAYRSNNIPWWTIAPGGSLLGAYVENSTPRRFTMEDSVGLSPMAFRRASDTTDRFRVDRDGALKWLDGANSGITRASISWQSATNTLAVGGAAYITNSLTLRRSDIFVASSGQAVTFSGASTALPAYSLIFQANFATANITITDGLDSGQLQILLLAGTMLGTAVTWPSNVHFNDVPAQPMTNKSVIVNLVKFGTDWYAVNDKMVQAPASRVFFNTAAVVLDASLNSRFMVETTSANITSMSIANAMDEQEIEIMFFRSGTQTIAFPTNVRWAGNTAPVFTAATRNYVRFKYAASSGLWYETGRSLAVPNV